MGSEAVLEKAILEKTGRCLQAWQSIAKDS
jgi:hypothetical protein